MIYSTAAFPAAEQSASIFGDKRTDRRLNQLGADIQSHASVNIKQLSGDRAKQKAYCCNWVVCQGIGIGFN